MKPNSLNQIKKVLLALGLIIGLGFLIPQDFRMPVEAADQGSYDQKSFWFYPWGKSITHKGVDIFTKKGTNIFSATSGIVVFAGEIDMGGKVVYVLGPKWRLHYYAHLDKINAKQFNFVGHKNVIGTVGNSGNAVGKSPHLHYAVKTLIPYEWRAERDRQGWRKMIYLNPTDYLNAYFDGKKNR